MSFFIRNSKGQRGRTKPGVKAVGGKRKIDTPSDIKKKKKKTGSGDDEILSDSDLEGENEQKKKGIDSSSEEEEETAQEKRLRLTKQYLAQLEAEEADKRDEEEIDKDVIGHRLKQDLLEQSGKLQKHIANEFQAPPPEDIIQLRGHQLSITCLVISADDKYVYSGSKDCSLIKWDFALKKKLKVIPGGRKGTEEKHIGHTAHILCLAISTDSKFLVSGDRNKLIHVWNPDTMTRLHTFQGHRDAVSGLAFRKNTHQLFSASHDRTVKIWNLDEMAYVETLFGHQDVITGIDALTRERAVTSGGRDGSVRIWKVIEESQLVFNGHGGSIDCVSLINETNFISGADDNSVAIWSVMKKKPLVTVQQAHSTESNSSASYEECWISAVTALQNTDLVASGSKDGCIRLWSCGQDFKTLTPVCKIPMVGFVNSLRFSSDGSWLIAGVGQEHRLGRWWRIKEAKNSICFIPLKRNKQDQS